MWSATLKSESTAASGPVLLYGADGEEKVVIGNYVNVQEGAVIHGNGMVIEDYVTIGHAVVVHGTRIGTGSLLGNNCTFLNRASVGKECLIAANSVVRSGTHVPDRSFFTGVPGTVKQPVNEDQIAMMKRTAKHLVERAKVFRDSGL